MTSSYEILTRIFFEHDFFPAKKFNGIAIALPDATKRCLVNLHLMYKEQPDGGILLYDTRAWENREKLLQQEIYLQFFCILKDQHFYNYTGLPASDISKTFFYFSNDPSRPPSADGKHLLHSAELVSEKDLVPAVRMPYVFSVKPFALLDIDLNSQLQDQYYVRFPVLATHWRYILVGEHLTSLDKPAVMDIATKEIFDGPETITLPNNQNAVSFISKMPMAPGEAGNKRFQLVENYDAATNKFKIVMGALPLPDVRTVSQAVKPQKGEQPKSSMEIFIY